MNPQEFCNNTLDQTDFAWLGKKYKGKVRDVYELNGNLILIATDRQSAFDISWCSIPLKGQVLTQLSAWWFNKIKNVMPNHFVSSPDPNVAVTRKLKMIPIEIVVRAYLTGTTETSAWVNYSRGVRDFCGNNLPDGMVKNQILPKVIITPTTKGEEDELVSIHEVVKRGFVSKEHWQIVTESALKLFKEGQRIAAERGLILVDTKYEMGLDENGVVTVADEVHTPDSSRYWIEKTYQERLSAGLEPDSLDKEFFRRWLVEQGFNPKQGHHSKRPNITDEVRIMLSQKYIELFERVTGEKFNYPEKKPILERIEKNLRAQLF